MSVATIKFYIREGLLPPPTLKTGRTMGYYDQAYLERLRLIRRLREEHFMPLRAIRLLLEERGDRPLSADESALLARVGPKVMHRLDPGSEAPGQGPLTRAQVIERFGLGDDQLELLRELGLLGDERGEHFSAMDLELLAALDRADKAGLSRDRFPMEGLGHYVELLGELAKREVRHFSHFATTSGIQGDELGRLAESATELVEPIVTVIRRKLILRAIRAELGETQAPGIPSTTKQENEP